MNPIAPLLGERQSPKGGILAFLAIYLVLAWGPAVAWGQANPRGGKVLFSTPSSSWAIAIHGGAGADPSKWTPQQIQAHLDGLKSALQLGAEQLKQGKLAIDVVEAVVRVLEDDPYYNAGRGAVLNEVGDPVLDASIMDGRDLSCGAVAGVRRIKNPISAARRIYQMTPHVLLSGDGADQFAKSIGLEMVEPDYFKTEEQIAKWKEWKEREANKSKTSRQPLPVSQDLIGNKGTVGCVALDTQGNLAAGTSTGGLLGKKFGRLGDSPIIGAGTYAKNQTCAVSCTGTGELYIKNVIAATISNKVEFGKATMVQAATEAINQVLPDDSGGLIAVDRLGNIAMPFNTPGMARGAATASGRFEIKLGKD
jgi:beta-aspartyl-peptidase (threonine type)